MLNPDYRDMLSALSAEGVEYLVVGAYALAAHGLPRATGDTVFQIGVAPRRIDLLTAIDGVDFESAWSRRESRAIDGLTVPVLSREDLLLNKRSTNRPKDKLDADLLEQNGR